MRWLSIWYTINSIYHLHIVFVTVKMYGPVKIDSSVWLVNWWRVIYCPIVTFVSCCPLAYKSRICANVSSSILYCRLRCSYISPENNNIKYIMSNKIPDSLSEEYDVDRDLTNLNWLMRNQNLTWPKTIDVNSEDGDIGSTQATIYSNQTDKSIVAHEEQKHFDYAKNYGTRSHDPLSVKKCSSATATPTTLKQPSPAERYEVFVNKIKRWE